MASAWQTVYIEVRALFDFAVFCRIWRSIRQQRDCIPLGKGSEVSRRTAPFIFFWVAMKGGLHPTSRYWPTIYLYLIPGYVSDFFRIVPFPRWWCVSRSSLKVQLTIINIRTIITRLFVRFSFSFHRLETNFLLIYNTLKTMSTTLESERAISRFEITSNNFLPFVLAFFFFQLKP